MSPAFIVVTLIALALTALLVYTRRALRKDVTEQFGKHRRTSMNASNACSKHLRNSSAMTASNAYAKISPPPGTCATMPGRTVRRGKPRSESSAARPAPTATTSSAKSSV